MNEDKKELTLEQLDEVAGGGLIIIDGDGDGSMPSFPDLKKPVKCYNCGKVVEVSPAFHGTITCPDCDSAIKVL